MVQQDYGQLIKLVQKYIANLSYPHSPLNLYNPIDYVLGLGGKRLRPVLMLLAYNLYKEDVETILPQAAAIETYHNFTLLHDDLMDNADMRRGKPTVHKKWNDNTAILSGDAMLILAYHFIIKGCPQEYIAKIMDVFNRATLDVCDGQQFDMDFETRNDVSIDEYMEMIRLKTSVLLAASLKIGAILAGAPDSDAERLYNYGVKLGLAFQLQDDYLDVYGDPAVFGKNIGGDICSNKKTFMLLTALNDSNPMQKTVLSEWINKREFNPNEKISAVTEIYNELNISEKCLNRINELYNEASYELEQVNVDNGLKENLKLFAQKLMNRES